MTVRIYLFPGRSLKNGSHYVDGNSLEWCFNKRHLSKGNFTDTPFLYSPLTGIAGTAKVCHICLNTWPIEVFLDALVSSENSLMGQLHDIPAILLRYHKLLELISMVDLRRLELPTQQSVLKHKLRLPSVRALLQFSSSCQLTELQ